MADRFGRYYVERCWLDAVQPCLWLAAAGGIPSGFVDDPCWCLARFGHLPHRFQQARQKEYPAHHRHGWRQDLHIRLPGMDELSPRCRHDWIGNLTPKFFTHTKTLPGESLYRHWRRFVPVQFVLLLISSTSPAPHQHFLKAKFPALLYSIAQPSGIML